MAIIDLLPGQELALAGFPALGAPLFPTEEGAGIFVAGKTPGPDWFSGAANRGARIDGFTIVGATQGGAIVVNGYARTSEHRQQPPDRPTPASTAAASASATRS